MEVIKGRRLKPGQIVRVYKNLHRDCFSIQDQRSGLVIAYATTVTLKNAVFRVQPAGHRRTVESNVRSVHAYVQGEFIEVNRDRPSQTTIEGYYNPFKTDTFINYKTGEPLHSAPLAHCQQDRVYCT